jgi:sterol desaturase/sphingolipid hydroxylase (fatty acid hydroxylase superfamily)
VLRLGLIPLLGLDIWHLVIYETLVVAVTQFHHADIGLGRFDPWLRLVIVTPDMHKVHHSDQRPETNSNYSTVLSIWDRLAGSFRTRTDTKSIVFGLNEFTDPGWQTSWGMLRTPFVKPPSTSTADQPEIDSHTS